MREFLIPENQNGIAHRDDPYTKEGAVEIVRRFKDDVDDMLRELFFNLDMYPDGKTILAKSPLARKVWVAAAMKTLGMVEEKPTKNGTCALIPTEKTIKMFSKRYASE